MKKGTTLEVRTKRSGILPGFIVLAVGGVAIDYDAGHWHLLHHMLGRYSVIVAFAVIVAFTWLVVHLCKRPEGYTSISSKEQE